MATCTGPGCTRLTNGTLCKQHRQQIARKGTLSALRIPLKTELERFLQKVEKTDGCWLWRGARDPHGYGRFRARGQTMFAHRYGYQELTGRALSSDFVIDHLCRQPACVRPDHLDPVPQMVNVRRGQAGEATRARAAAITHCPAGHPYSGENLYLVTTRRGGPNRMCRICRSDNDKKRKARMRQSNLSEQDGRDHGHADLLLIAAIAVGILLGALILTLLRNLGAEITL